MNNEAQRMTDEQYAQSETFEVIGNDPNNPLNNAQPAVENPDIPPQEEQPVAQEVSDEQETQQSDKTIPLDQPDLNPQAHNFRELRESKKRAEREAQEARERLQRLEQEIATLKPKPVEPEEDYGISDDTLVEGKQLKTLIKKQRDLEKKLQSYQQVSSAASAEAQLKATYPDINKVLSQDNIEMLNEMYPSLARSIASEQDVYTKGEAAYTAIKNMGIYKQDTYTRDKQKAQQNAAKPRPLVSGTAQQGESPLTQANAFAQGESLESIFERERRLMDEATQGWSDKDIW